MSFIEQAENKHDFDKVELGLRLLTRIGPAKTRQLFKHFKALDTIFISSHNDISELIGPKATNQLFSKSDAALASLIKKTCSWLHTQSGYFLTLTDNDYPKKLLDLVDPPPMLFMQGRFELLNSPSLAIVGSRSATRQGLYTADLFAGILTQCGFNIISGLAEGIDGAAHKSSLAATNDSALEVGTIAIMASGLDYIYPKTHKNLAKIISQRGLIITEWPLGVSPKPAHFPRRNRLIASLSLGVIVVEAAYHSGSLITARLANELGREVFAVPSSIYSAYAKGCHLLIKQGAKLIENVVDILEEIQLIIPPKEFGLLKKKIDAFLEKEKNTRKNLQKKLSSGIQNKKQLINICQTPNTDKPNQAINLFNKKNIVSIKSATKKCLTQNELTKNHTLTKIQQIVLNVMEFDPILFDELLSLTTIPSNELSVALFELEIKQLVERLPGNYYSKLCY